MQTKNQIVAITVSDIHLSHKPPICRSAEPNWYDVMERQLHELWMLQDEYECPILCAGDIFDKWNPPPELITFAIERLPLMYAIPGQHDLPHHDYNRMHESAYGVLKCAGAIIDLGVEPRWIDHTNIIVHPFPWNVELKPKQKKQYHKPYLDIALCHVYAWYKEHKYQTASSSNSIVTQKKKLKDYSTVIFGDNHKGFTASINANKEQRIANNGTFFRRTIAEQEYSPFVSLVLSDGTVRKHYLESCKNDKFADIKPTLEAIESALEATEFVDNLRNLVHDSINFVDTIKQAMQDRNVGERVRSIIMEVIEECQQASHGSSTKNC